MQLLLVLEATASNGVLVFNESIAATGLEATGSVGSVTVSLPIGATLTGVSASMPMTSTAAGGSLLGGLDVCRGAVCDLG